MTKSLEQLKEERNILLRKKNAKQSLLRLAIKRKIERKQLEAELKALKNPRSSVAKKTARRLLIKSSIALVRGGRAIGKHIAKIAAEQNRPQPVRRIRKKRKKRRSR